MRFIIFFSCVLGVSSSVFAGGCNDEFPVFTVNEDIIWQDISVDVIFEKADKKEILKAKKINATGILLADLIKPYADEGTLLIKSCGNKSKSFKVKDLMSDDKSKSSYYLAKTKKKTFKLVFANGEKKPRPLIKRVQAIDLISQKPTVKEVN